MVKYMVVGTLAGNGDAFEVKKRFDSEQDARTMIEAHIESGSFPYILNYEIKPVTEE